MRQGADVMPRSQLESVMKAELGDGWLERVQDFEWQPSAAASIGQVWVYRVCPPPVLLKIECACSERATSALSPPQRPLRFASKF